MKELSTKATKALIAINDIGALTRRVPLSTVAALLDEWEGSEAMGDLFKAFLVWRDSCAEFEAAQRAGKL